MPPKDALHTKQEEEQTEEREVFLRDGRRVVVNEQGSEPLVEVRSESGMVELRVRLTAEGPVLQMEMARVSLKATEAVTIESPRVEVKASERLALEGGEVKLHAEDDLDVDAKGDVRVVGKIIHLN